MSSMGQLQGAHGQSCKDTWQKGKPEEKKTQNNQEPARQRGWKSQRKHQTHLRGAGEIFNLQNWQKI